ncbi:MAG TPA: type I methionyl aminopeptidase [Ruania sp.]|nr:type I methionyl aminopeptidase [Ruania sp.]
MFRRIEYKTAAQMKAMRRAGLVVAEIHDEVRRAIRPGASTADLDAAAGRALERAGAASNFLGYYGFPGLICVSVNEEIVHGIPGERRLQAGDVVSVDAGAVVGGWHGDAAFSTVVPEADPADLDLLRATEHAMWSGIAALATARRIEDVGAAVEDAAGQYGIVREYTGHGIGTAMHQPPDVPNYRTGRRSPALKPGMCLAVEPMLTRGAEATVVLEDEWTVVTADSSRAAHFEHTVAVHPEGLWVLTCPDGGARALADFGVQVAPLH